MYKYKEDLVLNNLQWLISYKIWPRVVALYRVQSVAQIEMFDIETLDKEMTNV